MMNTEYKKIKHESSYKELLQSSLLDWYRKYRRKLPWREHPTPYLVWISEIMLQQTRVEAALGYYERFLKRLPDVKSLAEVEDDELHKLWEGLGYYNRAKNLKKCAKLLMEDYGGELPGSFDELLKLPGIGPYTAGAIASIAFGERVAAVDGNVLRVFSRMRRDRRDIGLGATKKELESYVQSLIPEDEAGDFNQALMELGALVCLPNGAPKCELCPIQELCLARLHGEESLYPVKKAPKKRRIEERTVLIITDETGNILIQKRGETGLLSGLWEFISLEGHYEKADLETMLQEMGLFSYRIEKIENAKHLFSHIEWHMEGYLVLLSEDDRLSLAGEDRSSYGQSKTSFRQNRLWSSPEALKKTYSIPSAFKVYMKSIEEGLVSTFLHSAKKNFEL